MADEVAVMREIIKTSGGKLDEMGMLPDGSGFATASYPLPKNHWLYVGGFNEPPPRPGEGATEQQWYGWLVAVARYAIRSATGNGTIIDFDPDAMVQQFLHGLGA